MDLLLLSFDHFVLFIFCFQHVIDPNSQQARDKPQFYKKILLKIKRVTEGSDKS